MRALYMTDQSIDGSPDSINPSASPCKALKSIKKLGFDTIIVRFLDTAALPTVVQMEFLTAARDCHDLRVILMMRLYDITPTVLELWEYTYYRERLKAINDWAELAVGFEWGVDCEWYGIYPWSGAENASLAVGLGTIIHHKMVRARQDSGVSPACMRVVGSSRVDKTNQPYAAFCDVCIGKTGYLKITKDTPDGPVVTPPPSVLAPYIDPATIRIIPAVQATAASVAFQPAGSTNWYHTYPANGLPAGELFAYVAETDLVAFLEAA